MKKFAGIDVGKAYLDVWFPGGLSQQFSNADAGFAALLVWLRDNAVEQVACDASSYERHLVRALHAARMPVKVVHPVRAKDYAKSCGRLAKTDQLDAQTLAEFATLMKLPPTPARSAESQALRDLMGRREQLVKQRVQEKNRLEKRPDEAVEASCLRHMAWLDGEIEAVNKACRECVRAAPELAERAALYQSVTGVGEVIAMTLLAYLPELGQVSDRRIAALMGVAPYTRDSGKMRGKRSIRGGRAQPRCAFYMGAVSACRYNPEMKAFYERLRARGKPPKVAQVAVMRKLLTQLNAVAKRGTPWLKNYTPAAVNIA